MKIKDVKDIVYHIERINEIDKSVIIFLGAGASVTSGIPTSNEIIKNIKNDPNLNKFIENDSVNYFEIMEQITPAERRRFFQKLVENSKINLTHLVLAILIYRGYVNTVLTTNFDNLIESSLGLFNINLNTIDLTNNVSIAGHSVSKPSLYYLHGKLHNVWQLNTKQELKRIKPDLQNLISKLSSDSLWIVIGYSGNDPVLDEFANLEKFDEGLYWIGYKDNEPNINVTQALLNDTSKNTFFTPGYTADSFFSELFTDLSLNETQLVEFLNKILELDRIRERTRNQSKTKLLHIKQTLLSKESKKWIVSLVQKQPLSDQKSLISKFLLIAKIRLKRLFLRTEPSISKIKLSLARGNFDRALSIVETELAQDSTNYIAHYNKGVVLATKASKLEPPSDRLPLYDDASEAFITAETLMQGEKQTPELQEDLNNSILEFWVQEYNQAVIIQNDDRLFEVTVDPFETSLAHLKNAAAVNPDSARTYQVLSSTYFELDQPDMAIESYEKAMNLLETPAAEDYEYLGSLYLYADEFEKAISISEEARELYPDNPVFVQFLADAYIQSGETEKAIEIVEGLIESDPDNPQYHRVLGTQIYQQVEDLSNELTPLYEQQFELRQAVSNQRGEELEETQAQIENLETRVENLEEDIDRLTGIAIREMERVIELQPDSESAHFVMGIIYQNRAANLFERRNNTMDNEVASEYDNRARENLQQARTYYETAAEINPDNPENWQSLYQVYVALGMEEKAQEAMEKLDYLQLGKN
jgi:tetratricopeptide (TPR) repeat protein